MNLVMMFRGLKLGQNSIHFVHPVMAKKKKENDISIENCQNEVILE